MKTLTTCMALSVCAAAQSLAQAPAVIAGAAFTAEVTNGTGPFARSGFFMFLPASSGSNYQCLGICGIGDQAGTYGYSASGQIGLAGLDFMGGSTALSLVFQSAAAGAFTQSSGTDTQSGGFTMLSGQAPDSVADVSIALVPEHAALPFVASNSLIETAVSGNACTFDSMVGSKSQHSTGTYSYSVVNRSTGVLRVHDSASGASELYLAFGGPLSGAYAMRQPSFGGYQMGTFRLWTLTNRWNLWWQYTNGAAAVWQMSGAVATAETRLNPPSAGTGWRIAAAADFNGDHQDDLLFESSSGALAVWLMSETNRQASAYLSPARVDPKWQVACTGDFNGDGQTDIVWQNADGALAIWLMSGLASTQSLRLNPSAEPGWRIVGAGDFNGDHQTDLLWESTGGRLMVWLMNGTSRAAVVTLNPPQVDPSWRVVGTKDFNGDGHTGIIWRQDSGTLSYWQMDGTNCVHSGRLTPVSSDTAWQVVGPR